MGSMFANFCFVAWVLCIYRLALGDSTDADDKKWKRSDDSSIPEAVRVLIDQQSVVIQQQSALMQQQSADLQALQAKVTALENQMATANSHISKLGQKVAFTAYFTEGGPIDIGQTSPIPFSHVTINTGNGYDTNTGIFTAPVAGDYLFLLHIKDDDASTEVNDIGIVKSGAFLALVTVRGDTEDNDRLSISVTTHVNAGQTVYARSSGSSVVIDKWMETSFSGILLFAD